MRRKVAVETRKVKIVVKDPISQEEKILEREISVSTWEKIEKLLETQDVVPKDKVIYAIQNLNIPAEAKAILVKIADMTLTIGNRVLSIGKRILELTLYFIREFPNATTGAVVGLVIGLAFNFIPWVGHFISGIVTPLFVALGLGIGILRDIREKSMREKIKQELLVDMARVEKEIKTQFGILREIE